MQTSIFLSRLPSEVTSLIFQELLATTKSSLALIPSASVCRELQERLKCDSLLWTELHLNSEIIAGHAGTLSGLSHKMERVISYSQNRPLTLTIDLVDGADENDTLDETPLHLHNLNPCVFHLALASCSRLIVRAPLWNQMETFLGMIDGHPSPLLESFHLLYQPHGLEAFHTRHALPTWRTGGISPLLVTGPLRIQAILPSLKEVVIDNLTHEWKLFNLTSLTSLCLRNIPDHNYPTYQELRNILDLNKDTLEELELSNISVLDPDIAGGRCTLSNVRKVVISFSSLEDLIWCAWTLDLPNLECLTLEDLTNPMMDDGTANSEDQAVETYSEVMRCWPLSRVKRLTLRNVRLPHREVVNWDESSFEEGWMGEEVERITLVHKFVLQFSQLIYLEVLHPQRAVLDALKIGGDIPASLQMVVV